MTSQPLIVVTGKGGTGKTTVAATLALGAAMDGQRTIVCETGRQTRIPSLFGQVPVAPGEEMQLASRLWWTTIDPLEALEEWLASQIPRRLVHILARSGAFGAFVNAAPGAKELVTVTKAWELGQAERWNRSARTYDVVVLDAPATGHGVGLLRTPRTFADIAQVGPIAGQARRVDAALADPDHTAYVAVALPGELAISETFELDAYLRDWFDRGLDTIVINGLWPRRIAHADATRLAATNGHVSAVALRAVRAAAGRSQVQQSQLARLRRKAQVPVVTLPYVFSQELRAQDLHELSRRLARRASDRRPVR